MEVFLDTYEDFVRFFSYFNNELETFFYIGCENWIKKQDYLPKDRQKLLEYLNTHFNPDNSCTKDKNKVFDGYFEVLDNFFKAESFESKYGHILKFEYATDVCKWDEFKYIMQENAIYYDILQRFSKIELLFWELCLICISDTKKEFEMKVDKLKNIKKSKEFALILEEINDFFVMALMVDNILDYRRYHNLGRRFKKK